MDEYRGGAEAPPNPGAQPGGAIAIGSMVSEFVVGNVQASVEDMVQVEGEKHGWSSSMANTKGKPPTARTTITMVDVIWKHNGEVQQQCPTCIYLPSAAEHYPGPTTSRPTTTCLGTGLHL